MKLFIFAILKKYTYTNKAGSYGNVFGKKRRYRKKMVCR